MFDNIYSAYINMPHRFDRDIKMKAELNRIGLKAERINGMYPQEYTGNPEKVGAMQRRTPGAIGCHFSQVKIMEKALSLNKSALVMEDDLVFCNDFMERMDYVDEWMKTHDWDVFWLGGTYHVNPARWHNSSHNQYLQRCQCHLNKDAEQTDDIRIMKTYGCWSTYAYIVNIKSLPKILQLLDENVHLSMGIDWLFILLQPQLNTFAFAPGCVKQYDNLSDIGINHLGTAQVTKFSAFANLGAYWFQERMIDFNPETFNWAEAKK